MDHEHLRASCSVSVRASWNTTDPVCGFFQTFVPFCPDFYHRVWSAWHFYTHTFNKTSFYVLETTKTRSQKIYICEAPCYRLLQTRTVGDAQAPAPLYSGVASLSPRWSQSPPGRIPMCLGLISHKTSDMEVVRAV